MSGKTAADEYITDEWYRVLGEHVHPSSDVVLHEILRKWNEPHRVYHKSDHLANALKVLRDKWYIRLTDREYKIAFIALLLHDYVYDIPPSPAGSNEVLSAYSTYWFLEETRLYVDPDLKSSVAQAILATEGHSNVRSLIDLVVCWCDLWNLAGPWKVAQRNGEAIRQEYMSVYTAEQWAEGRKKFLKSYRSPFHVYPGAPLRLRIQAKWLNLKANRNLDKEFRQTG